MKLCTYLIASDAALPEIYLGGIRRRVTGISISPVQPDSESVTMEGTRRCMNAPHRTLHCASIYKMQTRVARAPALIVGFDTLDPPPVILANMEYKLLSH